MLVESVEMLRCAGAMSAHVRAAPTDQPQLLRDERSLVQRLGIMILINKKIKYNVCLPKE